MRDDKYDLDALLAENPDCPEGVAILVKKKYGDDLDHPDSRELFLRMIRHKHRNDPEQLFKLVWAPEGKQIGVARARAAVLAVRMAPMPYRKYLGEIYAEVIPE